MDTFFSQTAKETLSSFHTDILQGLSSNDVVALQEKFGKNTFPSTGPRTTRLGIFFRQFANALMIVLVFAGVVSGMLGEYIDMTVILITAFLNAVIGYIQEHKADDALKRLKNMVSFKTLVLRDGRKQRIDTQELVPGDIVFIEAGDKIQADARILEVNELFVNEAALTGESEPIKKHTRVITSDVLIADRKNMIHRGTVVTNGRGVAVVVSTGIHTEIGTIAKLVRDTIDEKTPLQLQLSTLSGVISFIVVCISIAIFVIGILTKADDMVHLFETSVAIAVAAVPEGLVISLTVILAIGMRRVLKKNSLVRKLVAAETLGSVSVICADKTGTMTAGNMAVTRVVTFDHDEEMAELLSMSAEKRSTYDDMFFAFRLGLIANDGMLENPEADSKDWKLVGDTTDTALIVAGMNLGIPKHDIDEITPRIASMPFSSERKYIAAIVPQGDHFSLVIKGASELLLEKSTHIFSDGKQVLLTPERKKILEEQQHMLTTQGLRVIAVGYTHIEKKSSLREQDIAGLTFVALLALADPLRPDILDTLAQAKKAGIRTIMITGDHVETAKAIASDIGLPVTPDNIFDGRQIEELTDVALQKVVSNVSVFARVDPIHKIRIVKALQANGEVVAMTGDGVNDAPALKGADIGISLGSGTDVAKETSDMILLDDGFATIVSAISEGRTIYQNIRKVVLYLLSGSFASVILVTASMLLGYPLPVLAVQILWMNIVEDVFPVMALAFDKGDRENMNDTPRKKSVPLIDKKMLTMIVAKSLLANVFLFSLFVYFWHTTHDIALTRTIIFVGLGIDALFFVFSVRSLRRFIWQINPLDNRYLLGAVLFGWIMLFAGVYLPPLQFLLRTVPLHFSQWAFLLLFGLWNVVIIESIKGIFFWKEKSLRKISQ